ncbi:hypothetical protein GCM10010411_36540 [Actinomadura fulvescens]|uniref:Uncharacterized protein n=1 Tax=Actinomadura fulvescens TaxID=46160 RepID=A0ABP6C2V4_9ACTN
MAGGRSEAGPLLDEPVMDGWSLGVEGTVVVCPSVGAGFFMRREGLGGAGSVSPGSSERGAPPTGSAGSRGPLGSSECAAAPPEAAPGVRSGPAPASSSWTALCSAGGVTDPVPCPLESCRSLVPR